MVDDVQRGTLAMSLFCVVSNMMAPHDVQRGSWSDLSKYLCFFPELILRTNVKKTRKTISWKLT